MYTFEFERECPRCERIVLVKYRFEESENNKIRIDYFESCRYEFYREDITNNGS